MANLEYVNTNGAEYFLIKNILPVNEYDKVKFEIDFFKQMFLPPQETGTAYNLQTNEPLKQNRAVFLTNVLQGDDRAASVVMSSTVKVVENFMEYVRENLNESHSSFGNLGHDLNYTTLLSGYKDGDYYKPHRDTCVATLIWWFMEPEKKYEGGEFVLPDLGITISPESYTGVIIPSWYRHEVPPVRCETDDFVRYTVSCFLVYN